MRPKSLPHIKRVVLRSRVTGAATIRLMRETTLSLRETAERTQDLINETKAVIARADDLLLRGRRPSR